MHIGSSWLLGFCGFALARFGEMGICTSFERKI
jgi:hypothetical protein